MKRKLETKVGGSVYATWKTIVEPVFGNGDIGRRLNVPVVAKSADQFGLFGPFLSVDNPVSSALTQELMGWRPARPGLIVDLEEGHYVQQPEGNDSPQRAAKPNLHRGSLQPRKDRLA